MSTSGGTLGLLNSACRAAAVRERNCIEDCTRIHIGTAQMVAVCLLVCYGGLVLGVLLQVLQHVGGEALRCSVSRHCLR